MLHRNPDVVERQGRAWAAKYKQLMEAYEGEPGNAKGRGGSRRRESSMSGGSDLESSARLRPPQGRNRKDSSRSVSSDTESGAETGHRRKRNSESLVKTENVDGKQRKKQNSECSVEVKVNGKSKRTKGEMASSDTVS